MIKTTTYGAGNNILIAPELALTFGCIVGNTGVEADSEGKLIIKAGTPIGGTTSFVDNRQTVLVVSNDANAQGVILHDTDVTDGDTNATIVLEGTVDTLKLEVTVEDTAKTALTKINFVKGANR